MSLKEMLRFHFRATLKIAFVLIEVAGWQIVTCNSFSLWVQFTDMFTWTLCAGFRLMLCGWDWHTCKGKATPLMLLPPTEGLSVLTPLALLARLLRLPRVSFQSCVRVCVSPWILQSWKTKKEISLPCFYSEKMRVYYAGINIESALPLNPTEDNHARSV